MFSFSVYSVSQNATTEVKDAALAVYDQDRSALTYRIRDAMIAPQFKQVDDIDGNRIDRAMDLGEYSFVLVIPPNYTADLLAGKRPELQLLVDATAMSQAGVGSVYISQIVHRETAAYLGQHGNEAPFEPVVNALFNDNLRSEWFMPLNQLVGNAGLLTILLVGAAVNAPRSSKCATTANSSATAAKPSTPPCNPNSAPTASAKTCSTTNSPPASTCSTSTKPSAAAGKRKAPSQR